MTGLAVTSSTLLGALAAAALAVLGLHTSDRPSPTGDSSATSQPAVTPQRRSCNCLPRWLVWTLLLAIGGFALASGACLDACTGSNRIRHVPAIHGRVVDMETGQPLAGVTFTRWFERDMIVGPGGADSYRLAKSVRFAITDANGRFELPSWYGMTRGINAVRWTEFKPGWVAGWGHLATVNPPRLEIARKHPSHSSVEADTRHEDSTHTIVLKLHRVDTLSAAEDHFWALRILLDDRVIQKDDFVNEAAAYVQTHSLTEEMIGEVASLVPSGPCNTPYCRDPRIYILAEAVVSYCEHMPTSTYCEPRAAVLITRLREWLEKEHKDGQ